MTEIQAIQRLTRRAVVEAQLSVQELGRDDLWSTVQGLRERYIHAPDSIAALEELRAEALELLASLKN